MQTNTHNKHIYKYINYFSFITSRLGDYHDEMSSATFEEWWNEKLLPNIPSNSIIVMDNAPYHSWRKEEYPVQSWTKKKMAEWLDAKAIPYPDKCLKTDLWNIVRHHRPDQPEYYVDEVAKQAGHEVVRLPVAHCELNPIEMAWSQMKHYIRTHNTRFTLTEMERLTHLAFDKVTPDRWKSLIAHVQEKVEDYYWEADGLQMELVEEFIISLEGDSDSDSDSESDVTTSGDDSDSEIESSILESSIHDELIPAPFAASGSRETVH